MHSIPYRPTHDVSEPFEDGLVETYSVTDSQEGTGLLPQQQLTLKGKLRYQERKLGIQRYYQAKQNQILVQRVIRVPRTPATPITTQDVARTEDGKLYRIDLVQAVATYPPSYDLTLVKYEQVAEAEKEEEIEYDT